MDDIRSFEEKYKGSGEEREDLKKAYLTHEGDMDRIMEEVMVCCLLCACVCVACVCACVRACVCEGGWGNESVLFIIIIVSILGQCLHFRGYTMHARVSYTLVVSVVEAFRNVLTIQRGYTILFMSNRCFCFEKCAATLIATIAVYMHINTYRYHLQSRGPLLHTFSVYMYYRLSPSGSLC